MKVNNNFPVYKRGDIVHVKPEEQCGAYIVKVLRTWYPKETDSFSEREECKHLGLYMSKPKGTFPQLVCEILESTNKNQLIRTRNSSELYNLICLEGSEYSKLIPKYMEKEEYKKEFVQFLKTKRLYSAFMRNMKKQDFVEPATMERAVERALESLTNPINASFSWDYTPERFSFWNKVEALWLAHFHHNL
jgi:hypothetical protein